MKVNTTRFGELKVDKNDIIIFNEGILGFENLKKYFIVDPGDSTLILWLQSLEEPSIAFPIIEPRIFQPDYTVQLVPMELNSLELESLNKAKSYAVLTIPEKLSEMTANLKAPLVINAEKNIGRQIVLQNNKLSVKHEMYKELKTYIVNYHSDDSRRTNVNMSNQNQQSNDNLKHQNAHLNKSPNSETRSLEL